MQPRVLIICERAAERDTLRVLVGTMGCQWLLASNMEEALALLNREHASAALLELPGKISDPEQMDRNLRELLVRFPGRVTVMTDESPAPEVVEIVRKYRVPFFQLDRLTKDLWASLQPMVYPQLGIRRITQVARLVLDTFLRPLPAGIRFVQSDRRQLLYEAQSLTADISFELPSDSSRTTLLGQIMRKNGARVALSGASVVLKGDKGPLGLIMTNESGEFSFEFQDERKITLEIEAAPDQWVAIVSPPLDWRASDEHQAIASPPRAQPAGMNQGRANGKKGR